MAEDLQGLLDRISEKGLREAEAEKERLLEAAREEADAVLAGAQDKAAQITAAAERDAATLKSAGEEGLRQAARDVIVSLEGQITALLRRATSKVVGEAMTPEALAKIIGDLASAYAAQRGQVNSIEVLASKGQLDELEKAVQAGLGESFKAGVTVRPVTGIEAGIQISFDGESALYDFSSDAVAEMLGAYVNPRLLKIIRPHSDTQQAG